MFKACPVMEGHHEVWKFLSLWHLSKKWVVSLAFPCVQSAIQRSRQKLKIGRGGQVTGVALWVVGHFSSRSVVEIPDIRSAFRLMILSVFLFGWEPHSELTTNFLACFATMAARSAIHGPRVSLKASFGQPSSCGQLKLSKAGKEDESAAVLP